MVKNQTAVVENGRRLGQQLERDGESIALRQWATELLTECAKVADLMDQHTDRDLYRSAVDAQLAKVENPDLTPSAKVIQALGKSRSFFQFTIQQARQHGEFFANQPANAESTARLYAEARESLIKQNQIETADNMSFTDFLHDYLAL
jgi:glutamate--cysteine ligase